MTNYNDGKWHFWNGGECPVHPKSEVDMVWPLYLDDDVSSRGKRLAENFCWHVTEEVLPFMFRVVKEHKEPREFWVFCDCVFSIKEKAEEFRTKMISENPDFGFENDGIIHVREVME